jgi:protein-disulfide isomerase
MRTMKMRRWSQRLPLVGICIVALALFAACGGDDSDDTETADVSGRQSDVRSELPTSEPQSVADIVLHSHVDEGLTSGRRMGVEAAPLVLEVFEDFLCSHCLAFTVNVEPTLIEEYVNEGKLAIEFRHFPVLGRGAVASAIAAECAVDQEAFWPYHRLLFANQANGIAPSPNGFIGLASSLELDLVEFEACLNDTATLATVQADFDLAQSIGFTGTPSFRLNGVALPGQPNSLDGWRALLDGELDEAN